MAKRFDVIRLTPRKGLVDGGDEQDVPHDALWITKGFEFRRGFARTERGRLKYTNDGALSEDKRVENLFEWTQADGRVRFLAVSSGFLLHVYSSGGALTILNTLTLGGSTATRSTLVVTVSGGQCLNSVRAGDWFWIAGDTRLTGGRVSSVDSDTQFTLASYAGSQTSGNFTLYRMLGEFSGGSWDDSEVSMAVFGDKLYIADGHGPLHSLSADLSTFRPVGVIKPDDHPTLVLASGGALSAGNYRWMVAWEDADGIIGPGETSLEITATATQRCTVTFGSSAAPPPWVTKVRVYRTLANGGTFYHVTKDFTVRLASITNDTVTLDSGAQALTVDAHIGRYLVFEATGNSYRIIDNDATTIQVHTEIDIESLTDWITVAGGYDVGQVGTFTDLVADADLDFNNEGPGNITNTDRSYNEPPPVGLKYLTKFRGGGRLAALEDGTQTRIWISGRPQIASKTGQPEYFGELEPEYWPYFHDAGPKDGDDVQGVIEIGFKLCAIKRNSVWELDQESSDSSLWGWGPIMGAEKIGCIAPKSIVTREGVAFWLGRTGEALDIIRFDGVFARGFAKPKLRATLADMTSVSSATAAIFGDRLYVSYTETGESINTATLRYDFHAGAFDIQPWGCGVFAARLSESKLYCADPDDAFHIYEVLGSAQDNGSDISRTLQTGDVGFEDTEHPVRWTEIAIEVKIE